MSNFLLDYEAEVRATAKVLLNSGFTPAVWTSGATYAVNVLVKPTEDNETGLYYRCTVAGTVAATEPDWPEGYGETITDGGVTWKAEEPVYVLDYYPDDFSYPCVVIGEMATVEGQIAGGNHPVLDINLTLSCIAYLAAATKKTFDQTREQVYAILKQVQQIIRNNPNFSNMPGILRATSGAITPDEELPPVIWRKNVPWVIRMMARR